MEIQRWHTIIQIFVSESSTYLGQQGYESYWHKNCALDHAILIDFGLVAPYDDIDLHV